MCVVCLVYEAYITYWCPVRAKVKKSDADDPVQAVLGNNGFNSLPVQSRMQDQERAESVRDNFRDSICAFCFLRGDGDDIYCCLPNHYPDEEGDVVDIFSSYQTSKYREEGLD